MVEWQAIAAMGGTLVAIIALFVGWVCWLFRIVREDVRELREDMRTMEQRLVDRMDRNHRELLAYLLGHAHADGSPPAFHLVSFSLGLDRPSSEFLLVMFPPVPVSPRFGSRNPLLRLCSRPRLQGVPRRLFVDLAARSCTMPAPLRRFLLTRP